MFRDQINIFQGFLPHTIKELIEKSQIKCLNFLPECCMTVQKYEFVYCFSMYKMFRMIILRKIASI